MATLRRFNEPYRPMPGAAAAVQPRSPTRGPLVRPRPTGQPGQAPAAAQPQPTPNVPSPMPPGGVPPVAGAAINPIQPSQDLRFQAITPDNAGAPNLTALAQQKYQDFIAGTADERTRGLRQIGQRAASLGRVGHGGVSTDIGNLEADIQRRQAEAARGLASDVALSDLGERRAQRDELRGERGYQVDRSESAIDRRLQQQLIEDQLLNSRFGRDVTRTSLGYQGNPSDTQMRAGESYGRSADDALGGVGDFLESEEIRKWLESQGMIPRPPGTLPAGTRVDDRVGTYG